MVRNPDKWRTLLLSDFRVEEEHLRRFLVDEEAADTLRWVCGELRALYDLGSMFVQADSATAALDDRALEELETDTEFQPLMRGTIALMAAAQLAKHIGDPGRAHDLLDVAFLELRRFGDTLRKRGVTLFPYPDESVEERGQRRLRAIRSLQAGFTDVDWSVLEQARIRDLR